MTPQDKIKQASISLEEFEDAVGDELGIPKNLRRAMVGQESGGRHRNKDGSVLTSGGKAKQYGGARGRWQVLPGTAKKYGMNPDDEFDNAYAGMSYLRELYDQARQSAGSDADAWAAAVAGYHGGESQVRHINKTGAIAERNDGHISTPNYVDSVLKRWSDLEARAGSDGNSPPVGAASGSRLGDEEITRRQNVEQAIQAFEGMKKEAARLVSSKDELERARGYGLLDKANKLAEQIGAAAGDLVETGQGKGWAYIKPRENFAYQARPHWTESAFRALRPETTKDLHDQQQQIQAERARFQGRSWIGQQAEKLFTEFASGDSQMSPEAQRDLAIRRQALGLEYTPPEERSGPRRALDALRSGYNSLLATVPEGAGELATTIIEATHPGRKFEEGTSPAAAGKKLTDMALRSVQAGAPLDPNDQGWLTAKIPQAFGSALGFMHGGGSKVASAVLGAVTNLQQIVSEYDRVKGPKEYRELAKAVGALTGTLEAAGLGETFAKWGGQKRLIQSIKEFGEEGLQEYVNELSNDYNLNLIAGDQTRSLNPFSANKLEAGALGAIAAVPFQAGAMLAGRGKKGEEEDQASAALPTTAPPAAPPATAPATPPTTPPTTPRPGVPDGVKVFRSGEVLPAREKGFRHIPIETSSGEAVTVVAPETLGGQRVSEDMARPWAEAAIRPAEAESKPKPAPAGPVTFGEGVTVHDIADKPKYDPQTQKSVTFKDADGTIKAAIIPKRMTRTDGIAVARQMLGTKPSQPSQAATASAGKVRFGDEVEVFMGDSSPEYDPATQKIISFSRGLRSYVAVAPKHMGRAEAIQAANRRLDRGKPGATPAQAGAETAGRGQTSDAPLLSPDAVVNPDGGVPENQVITGSAKRPGEVAKPTGQVDKELGVNLANYVLRRGGIKASKDDKGELSYLLGREGGRPGMINNRDGLSLDMMREDANSAGYGPFETIDEFLSALTDHGDTTFPQGYDPILDPKRQSAEDQAEVEDAEAFQNFLYDPDMRDLYDKVSSGQGTPDDEAEFRAGASRYRLSDRGIEAVIEAGRREKSRREGGEEDTGETAPPAAPVESRPAAPPAAPVESRPAAPPAAPAGPATPPAVDNTLRPSQDERIDEETRRDRGEGLSQYVELKLANYETIEQLMDLEPWGRGTSDAMDVFDDGIARLYASAESRGIEPRHVKALITDIMDWHREKAMYLDWAEREAKRLKVDWNDEELERGVMALDAMHEDEVALELLKAANAGDDNALQALAEYAEDEYGIRQSSIRESVRLYRETFNRRPASHAVQSGSVHGNLQGRREAQNPEISKEEAEQLRKLLAVDLTSIPPENYDAYMEAVEKWQHRSIRKGDIPEHLDKLIWRRIKDIRRRRSELVKQKLLPALFKNNTLTKQEVEEKLARERAEREAEAARQAQEAELSAGQKKALDEIRGSVKPTVLSWLTGRIGATADEVRDLVTRGLIREADGGYLPASAPERKSEKAIREREEVKSLSADEKARYEQQRMAGVEHDQAFAYAKKQGPILDDMKAAEPKPAESKPVETAPAKDDLAEAVAGIGDILGVTAEQKPAEAKPAPTIPAGLPTDAEKEKRRLQQKKEYNLLTEEQQTVYRQERNRGRSHGEAMNSARKVGERKQPAKPDVPDVPTLFGDADAFPDEDNPKPDSAAKSGITLDVGGKFRYRDKVYNLTDIAGEQHGGMQVTAVREGGTTEMHWPTLEAFEEDTGYKVKRPASVLASLQEASDQQASHSDALRQIADSLPDGTNIQGWVKETVDGKVFWTKGRKGVVFVADEVGGKAVVKAAGLPEDAAFNPEQYLNPDRPKPARSASDIFDDVIGEIEAEEAEAKPAKTDSPKLSIEDVKAPDGWETSVFQAGVYANRLMDAGVVPESVREEWRQLWTDETALLNSIRKFVGKPEIKPEKKPKPKPARSSSDIFDDVIGEIEAEEAAESKPAGSKVAKIEDVPHADDWERSLLRVRDYAKNLMDAGFVPEDVRDEWLSNWSDADALAKSIKSLIGTKGVESAAYATDKPRQAGVHSATAYSDGETITVVYRFDSTDYPVTIPIDELSPSASVADQLLEGSGVPLEYKNAGGQKLKIRKGSLSYDTARNLGLDAAMEVANKVRAARMSRPQHVVEPSMPEKPAESKPATRVQVIQGKTVSSHGWRFDARSEDGGATVTLTADNSVRDVKINVRLDEYEGTVRWGKAVLQSLELQKRYSPQEEHDIAGAIVNAVGDVRRLVSLGGSETTQAEESTPDKPLARKPENLPQHIANLFKQGRSFKTIVDARREVGEFLGMRIDPGTVEAKQADEYIEQGVVLAAREIVKQYKGDPLETYQALVDLYNRQPNLNVRTSVSVANQAYSTPMPIAFVASHLAGITDKSVVFEPTAGNGALLIAANLANVYANELNPERAKFLRKQGVRVVQERDASGRLTGLRAEDAAPPKGVDVVIANPPFGVVKDDSGASRKWQIHEGYTTTEIDHAITFRALEAMKTKGSAVLILGGLNKLKVTDMDRRIGYNAKAKRLFYATLYERYNVVDHVTLSGDMYAKQGAGWPVDIIVIRGRGKSSLPHPAKKAPPVIKNYEQLEGILNSPALYDQTGADSSLGAGKQPQGGRGAGVRGAGNTGQSPLFGTPDRSSGASDKGRPATEKGGAVSEGGTAQGRPDRRSDATDTGTDAESGSVGQAPGSRGVSSEGVSRPGGKSESSSGDRGNKSGGVGSGSPAVKSNSDLFDDIVDELEQEEKAQASDDLKKGATTESHGWFFQFDTSDYGSTATVRVTTPRGETEIPIKPFIDRSLSDLARTVVKEVRYKGLDPSWVPDLEKAAYDAAVALNREIEQTGIYGFTEDQLKAPQPTKRQAPTKPAKQSSMFGDESPRQGKVGDKLAAGEVVLTLTGRETTPFPDIKTDTERKSQQTLRRVDEWLRENAIAEAEAREDDYNARIFEASNPKNLSQSDKDSFEEYLFGYQPPVVKSSLKPLVNPSLKKAGEKTVEAVKDTAKGLGEAVQGINDLFFDPRKANMGFTFDEDTYRKAKPHFEKAYNHFKDAVANVEEAMREFVKTLKAQLNLTVDQLKQLKPYILRFIEDVTTKPETKPETKTDDAPQDSETHRTYKPVSGANPVGTLVPLNMASATEEALKALEGRVGGLDQYIADKLGYDADSIGEYFSGEQVDALALAIDNMERGSGFVIGDQTGIGKGRVVAGVIRYALSLGKTPIFVTEKPALFGDMIRDLVDIGIPTAGQRPKKTNHDPITPLITNNNEEVPLSPEAYAWIAEAEAAKITGRPVPKKPKEGWLKTPPADRHAPLVDKIAAAGSLRGSGHDVIFTTYAQMQKIKGASAPRHRLLDNLSNGAVLIFDESHNAGGGIPKVKQGEVVEDRAQFARALARKAHAVFFSSATYAKRPEVMDLYARTSLGKAVTDPSSLAPLIQRGGVPLQQVVASMLTRAGQYLRRERSFDGIEYRTTPVQVSEAAAREIPTILSRIVEFDVMRQPAIEILMDNLMGEGGVAHDSGLSVNSTNFTALMHNVIDQMLLAMKVVPAVDLAVEALEAGEKPVLTLANTMGAFIEQYTEDNEIDPGQPLQLDFRAILERYLERSKRVSIKTDKQWGSPVQHHFLTDEELGPAAVEHFAETMRMIRALDLGDLPISPIDYLHNELRKRGYKTAEITGRGATVDYAGDVPVYKLRPGSERSTAGKKNAINGFNEGAVDVLVINQSGSTGISLHANRPFRDTRRRVMILIQPERNIDTHMQMLGRINRTGQVTEKESQYHRAPAGKPAKYGLPRYVQMAADIPAENRPAAVLAKKMASLNANTTAAKTSAVTSKEAPDFMNKYGGQIVAQILTENPDLNRRLDSPYDPSEDDYGDSDYEDLIRKVTGRVPLLPLDQQIAIYEQIESEYEDLIARLDAMGTNDLDAKTLDLKAEVIGDPKVLSQGVEGDPFTAPVLLEKSRVKRLGKPLPAADVLARLSEELGEQVTNITDAEVKGGKKQKELINQTEKAYNEYIKADLDQYDRRIAATEGHLEAERSDDPASSKTLKLEKELDTLRLKRQAAQTLATTNWLRWQQKMNLFAPGTPVEMKTDQGSLYGVVASVKRKIESKNPIVSSGWRVQFLVADAMRSIDLPLSQLKVDADDPGMGLMVSWKSRFQIFNSETMDVETIEVLEAFDRGQSDSSETRYILTGNLLSGFDAVNGRGQILHFTTADGQVRQGVLMPRGFDPNEEIKRKPVVFSRPAQVIEFLRSGIGGRLVSASDKQILEVTTQHSGNAVILDVPSSKGLGGRYYLNRRLIEIVGGEGFVKVGGRMKATVPFDTAEEFFKAMYDGAIGNMPIYLMAKNNLDKAAEITGQSPGQMETETGSSMSSIDDQLSKGSGAVLRTFKGEEGMEARVVRGEKGFNVVLYDTEANEAASRVTIYKDYGEAVKKARELVVGGNAGSIMLDSGKDAPPYKGMSPAEFRKFADGGKVVKATGAISEAEKRDSGKVLSGLRQGRNAGYSFQDIAHYYVATEAQIYAWEHDLIGAGFRLYEKGNSRKLIDKVLAAGFDPYKPAQRYLIEDAAEGFQLDNRAEVDFSGLMRLKKDWVGTPLRKHRDYASAMRDIRWRQSSSKQGVIYGNEHAHFLLWKVVSTRSKNDADFRGLKMRAAQAIRAANDMISATFLTEGDPVARAQVLKFAQALKSAAVGGEDVHYVRVANRVGWREVRKTVYHELTHSAEPKTVKGEKWFESLPVYGKVARVLEGLGYRKDEYLSETIARVLAGQRADLGLYLDEATDFLAAYFDHLDENIGPAAVHEFKPQNVSPEMRPAVRKAQDEKRLPGGRDGVREPSLRERRNEFQFDRGAEGVPDGGSGRSSQVSGIDGDEPAPVETLTRREKLGRKIGTTQAIAQLLNPRTISQNLIGNAAFSGAKNLASVAAIPLDKLLSLKTKQRQVITPDLRSQYHDFVDGFIDIWSAVRHKDYSHLQSNKYELHNERIFSSQVGQFFEDVMDITLRGPDRGAFLAAYNDAVNQIMRGYERSGEKFSLEKVHQRATMEAQEAIFQDKNLISDTMVGLKKLINRFSPFGEKAHFGLADLIGLKYPRVPSGLVMRAIEYSPYSLAKALKDSALVLAGKGDTFSQRDAAQAFGKGIVGTAFGSGMGVLLQALGILLAPNDDKRGVGTVERSEGLFGYQVNFSALKRYAMGGMLDAFQSGNLSAGRLREGDKLYSIDWFQPWAFSLAMGASAARAVREGAVDRGTLADTLAAIDAASSALVDESILRNVKELTERGVYYTGRRVLTDTPSSFVPGMLGQVRRAVDERAREIERGEGVKGVSLEALQKVMNRLPGASSRLKEKRDLLDRPVPTRDSGAAGVVSSFLPGRLATHRPHEYLDEMRAHELGTTGTRKRDDESSAEFRVRRAKASRLLGEYGLGLVRSQHYKDADRETRKEALTIIKERIYKGGDKPADTHLSPIEVVAAARRRLKERSERK